MQSELKILYTTPVLRYPPASGPELRVENSIIALSKLSEVHLISRNDKDSIGGEEADEFYRSYSTYYEYSPSTNPAEIWPTSFLSRVINKISYVLFKKLPLKNDVIKKDVDFLISHADKEGIKIIWFGYGNVSFPVMKAISERRPDLKLVCDTDSVWSRFVLRELPYIEDVKRKKQVQKEGEEKEREEKAWVKFCDITTGVSQVDVEFYQEIADDNNKIRIFSNVINVESYSKPPPPPEHMKQPSMYLAGSFWKDSPMENAARWVLKSVLPLIKEAIPDIHFYIVGRGSDIILEDVKDDSVTITGMLPSVLPYLCNVDVSLVPLTFESGTRYKILEAAACGIPIVSTTLGAEGIPITHGENILIADKEAEFASAIVKLIQDKEYAKTLSERCLELVNKNYGIDVLVKEGKDIIEVLTQEVN